MEGTCPCGGKLKEHNHNVLTYEGARKWHVLCEMPAHVEQTTCTGCGRGGHRIFDVNDKLVVDKL